MAVKRVPFIEVQVPDTERGQPVERTVEVEVQRGGTYISLAPRGQRAIVKFDLNDLLDAAGA